jgi:hypothetical protein
MKHLLIAVMALTFALPPIAAWASLTQTEVSQLYIGVFGRASEGGGNSYWQTDPESTSMTATANVMLNTDPAKAYFGDTMNDNGAFVAHIYSYTLGKSYADDPTGQDYWVSELVAGKSKGEMIAALISSAQHPDNLGAAQDRFNNKVEVSNYCADTIADYTDLETFTGFLSSVTDDHLSVTHAIELINSSDPVQQTSFKFSTDWLNAKTLYNVYLDDEGKWTIATFAFTDTSYTAFNNIDPTERADNCPYTISAEGDLILTDPDNTSNIDVIRAVEETADYLTVLYGDSIDSINNSSTDFDEYFFFYLQDAQVFIDTKNAEFANR